MAVKKIYKNPKEGQPLISTISVGCHTPVLEVKFCSLVNPFRYPNSPTIPRYSVTCLVDPEEHGEFLNVLRTIEKDEKVESILKHDTAKEGGITVQTGKYLVKFQSKEAIPVFLSGKFAKGETPQVELQDELAKGEKIEVVYDILRYTKKNAANTEYGLSFRPTCIYYYATEEALDD